ncbi:MAG: ABC transporter ATP-binding protein [Clostridia bacterium]|nr:ABC transporter ATP-binding protein [Clostridia bacterium]
MIEAGTATADMLDFLSTCLCYGVSIGVAGGTGSGKSTLMSVLFGLYQPDGGEILLNGKKVKINNPNDANALGIGMVHQHFKLVEVFSVLDNIILGVEPSYAGFIKRKEAEKKLTQVSKKYGLNVEPNAIVEDISVGMQQRVEILKMLYRENNILIFDEPTAVLTPQEIEELMVIMKNFAKEGKSILFITHKLNEIKLVADRCTVLRKGRLVGTVDVKSASKEELSKMMVGRDINFAIEKKAIEKGEKILEVKGLSVASKLHKNNAVKNVTFDVYAGEILCIAGIDGNGQTELGYSIIGLEKPVKGNIIFQGKDITRRPIRERSARGMSHIPEDRHKYGLILDFSLEENLVLARYWQPEFQKAKLIRFKNVRKYAQKLIDAYDIRSGRGAVASTRSMSGGNQQKAIVAREIDKEPQLLLAVQPTRGLDVGAIEYIHKMLVNVRDSGRAVLLISLELEEVINVADRILVIYEGEIVAELDPRKTSMQEIGLYMSGAQRQSQFQHEEVKHEKA